MNSMQRLKHFIPTGVAYCIMHVYNKVIKMKGKKIFKIPKSKTL